MVIFLSYLTRFLVAGAIMAFLRFPVATIVTILIYFAMLICPIVYHKNTDLTADFEFESTDFVLPAILSTFIVLYLIFNSTFLLVPMAFLFGFLVSSSMFDAKIKQVYIIDAIIVLVPIVLSRFFMTSTGYGTDMLFIYAVCAIFLVLGILKKIGMGDVLAILACGIVARGIPFGAFYFLVAMTIANVLFAIVSLIKGELKTREAFFPYLAIGATIGFLGFISPEILIK